MNRMLATVGCMLALVALPALAQEDLEGNEDPLKAFYTKASVDRATCALNITSKVLEYKVSQFSQASPRIPQASVLDAARRCIKDAKEDGEALLDAAYVAWRQRSDSSEPLDAFVSDWRESLDDLEPLDTELRSKRSDHYSGRVMPGGHALRRKWEELVPSPPRPSPFGLKMGLSYKLLEQEIGTNLKEGGTYTYSVDQVPRPHPDFESYILVVAPDSGLCQIRAVGKAIDTNVFGEQLMAHFLELIMQLGSNYGTFEATDFDVKEGSIWDEPEDFMMGLLENDRVIRSVWMEEHDSRLQNDIEEITLAAGALSRTSGFLLLQYSYSNVDECVREIREKEKNVL